MQAVLALCLTYTVATMQPLTGKPVCLAPRNVVVTAEQLYVGTWAHEPGQTAVPACYLPPETLMQLDSDCSCLNIATFTGKMPLESDSWVVAAIVLHAALGGASPYAGLTAQAVLNDVKQDEHRLARALRSASLDVALTELLAACLQPAVAARAACRSAACARL